MPTSSGPNQKGEENLVFAYDVGDVKNSYRGEPATNSQNADISSMTQVGFNGWSCYDGSPPYHTWGTNQSKTFVTVPGPFGTSVNAMLYHNFNGGFYGPTDWGAVPNGTITSGRTYTVQGWVKAADSSSVGNSVNVHTYYSHSGGAYSAGTNYTLTDQWQLVSHTHTVQYNATGGGIMYFFTQNPGEVKMYLTMTGVFLDESHAVPWIIGGSTRSNTQGLLDLTGNNTIDLSNVSFDSNAKITFDGTDDYFTTSTTAPSLQGNSTFSVEGVFRRNGNILQQGFWGIGGGTTLQGICSWNYILTNEIGIDLWGTSTYGTGQTYSSAEWKHIVWTYNGTSFTTSNISIFVNSVKYTGGTLITRRGGSGTPNINNTGITLGRINSNTSGYHANGQVPVFKAYNKILSDNEVKQNYQQYKTRFNLS